MRVDDSDASSSVSSGELEEVRNEQVDVASTWDSSSDDDKDSDGQDSVESEEAQEPFALADDERNVDEDLSHLPLSERIKQLEEKRTDHIASRERKRKALQIAGERLTSSNAVTEFSAMEKKKKSKHAPKEASSKRRDFFKQKVLLSDSGIGVEIGAHLYKPRDPRMSSLSGDVDYEQFDRNYAFLQDLKKKEIELLKKKIAARKLSGRKGRDARKKLGIDNDGRSVEDDQADLKRLKQEQADFERRQVERAAKRAVKKKLIQGVEEGKRGVYYPKRRELKKMQLEAKFEEIKKRGGDRAVDKLLAKRRKKNKSRDAGLLGDRV